jgi:hypothetical protein
MRSISPAQDFSSGLPLRSRPLDASTSLQKAPNYGFQTRIVAFGGFGVCDDDHSLGVMKNSERSEESADSFLSDSAY